MDSPDVPAAVPRPRIGDLTVSNLRAEIARRGLSGEAFGRGMSWSKATTSRKLSGRTRLTLDELDQAAGLLDVDVVTLLVPPMPRQAAS